ncbi:protein of unknown function [Micromonospora echinofusca]|uniref:DUF397 domain-containing protein n=1 Tax=Micromonospora echinofusca TaxID=47858 RepID=A0A1C5G754_MICEH|nr:DUF397 domain-containing protein [Micromonospora echinofusca]SCG15537.1 protein of unknown function [Micromonospora echinofusca]
MAQRHLNSWFKSTKSGPNCDNCVDIKFNGGGNVEVRSSRDPQGPTIVFDAGEWDAFIAGAKAGEFDIPAHAR